MAAEGILSKGNKSQNRSSGCNSCGKEDREIIMKFNYKLHRLCGLSYGCPTGTATVATNASGLSAKGSNVAYTTDGNTLLSPVSNRIQAIDLVTHSVRTLANLLR